MNYWINIFLVVKPRFQSTLVKYVFSSNIWKHFILKFSRETDAWRHHREKFSQVRSESASNLTKDLFIIISAFKIDEFTLLIDSYGKHDVLKWNIYDAYWDV